MHYVISDIHGELEQLKNLLKQIHFSQKDELYILGDVVDRGPNPIKTLQYLMSFSNVTCIVGNHELMALTNLKLLLNEITSDFLDHLSASDYGMLLDWVLNGASTTIQEFSTLSMEEREEIIDFLGEFIAYEELCINGQEYVLVHAGMEDFSEEKPMDAYCIDDLVWTRIDYEVSYYRDKIVVSGHTPTQTIPGNENPGYIFRANNHIAIDCGAHHKGGRLAAICLETGEEFYSKPI